MASSPTSPSSSSSSSSSPFSSSAPYSAHLPVTALRTRIVEKILDNRVTLIVGETGCGKSSQVPQFLLEENMEPILCTQPRRFAVVALARMVAKARNCEVGSEIGYHIGHSRLFSSSSKIVFKTAGVLLDEMRERGLNSLKYKVIILDEVHERSVESDLVLVCVKQFLLKNKDLRLVLMSATADIDRYRDYFKHLGRGERVEVLAIPSTGQQIIFQRSVLYLEQIAELLGMSSEQLSLRYCSGESPSTADADIKPEVQNLIYKLVLRIHESEPDIEKSILVFLPTYYSLEQQWFLLREFSPSFKILILHSSVDIEQALKAMKICHSFRKVILTTNIAESSVTIPQVAYVIDSCRSLQVFWDSVKRTDSAELVWVSKSQADQRRGRTGRTCNGQIYRLVTESFFGQLQKYEPPTILRLSLRQQLLHLCCATSKAINDPAVLLQKALDPPDPRVIEDALSLLVHMNALERMHPRGRYEPTFYGRLLASFSLSFDASVLVVKFGEMGMLREGIIIGILMDTQPLPIIRPFGQETQFAEYIGSFYSGDSRTTGLSGKKEMLFMGNFCAFQFWQRVFNDKQRLKVLKQSLAFNDAKDTLVSLLKIEEEWCSNHNLLHSSLHQVEELYKEVLNSFHCFRPKFFATCDGLPCYYDPLIFGHECCLEKIIGSFDVHDGDDKQLEIASETMRCVNVPFVASSDFQTDQVAKMMADVIKEMRTCLMEHSSGYGLDTVNGLQVAGEAAVPRFFMNGFCSRGSQYLLSDSIQENRPVCRFFLSLQGCRNGDSCFFSHDLEPMVLSRNWSSSCIPEEGACAASLLQLLPTYGDGVLLVLDDVDFHFSSHLARLFNPSSIICTTPVAYSSERDPLLHDIRVIWGLSHPHQTIICQKGDNTIPWNEVGCVLWFPNFDGSEFCLEQKNMLQTFFSYLAIRLLVESLYEVLLILTMNNIRFSQLQVEELGRNCFFFLRESFPYDESAFGLLSDSNNFRKRMIVSRPISYVFNICPPSDILTGDYMDDLRRHLHKMGDNAEIVL